MVETGDSICIRKIRGRRYLYALIFQALHNFFFGIQIGAAADGKRPLGKKISQDLFCSFLSICIQPSCYQILRHGILHGKIFQKIFFLLREADLVHFPCNGAKHTVYKRLQVIKALALCQLHSFIAHCAVRHAVHIFQLVYRTS